MLLGAGLVVGVVVAMAFFVRGFDNTSGGDAALAAPTPGGSASIAVPVPMPSAKSAKSAKYVDPATGKTIDLGQNDAPGLKIDNVYQHRLVVTVTSRQPVYAVGWLIPTSMNYSYGRNMQPGRHFSLVTRVTGRPYYSIIWVWAGKAGAPATCTVSIDGHVRTSKTTTGSYGRQLCFA